MNEQVFEANAIHHIAGFYPVALTPELAEIAPGDVWRIIIERDQPVAVYKFGEYAIVVNGLSGFAYTRAFAFGRHRLFETTFENVRKLADLIIRQHALVLADEANEILSTSPEVKRQFSGHASMLRALLACQRIELVNQITHA